MSESDNSESNPSNFSTLQPQRPQGQVKYIRKRVRVKKSKSKAAKLNGSPSSFSSPSPNTSDHDQSFDSEAVIRDLTDSSCSIWEDAISKFGNPEVLGEDNEEAKEAKHESLRTKRYTRTRNKGGQQPLMNTIESENLLKQHNEFDVNEYIKAIFGYKPIKQYELASYDYHKGSKSSNQSRKTIIAENIHNYVKAQEDLLATEQQFAEKKFPGQNDIENLLNQLKTLQDGMESFFNPVLKQQKEASDSNALLQRISSYSFIFTLAAEIDKLRSLGQFEEINRMHHKTKQYKFLGNVPLFANAFKTVQTSYANVETSLKAKIENMTIDTYNRDYCELYIEIHQSSTQVKNHQLVDIIDEIIDKRIHSRFSLDIKSMADKIEIVHDTCQLIESALPLCFKLRDLLKEVSMSGYEKMKGYVEERLISCIADINQYTLSIFKLVQNTKVGVFNHEAHQIIIRVLRMWGSQEPLIPKIREWKSIQNKIIEVKQDLQDLYNNYLVTNIQKILDTNDPGSTIIDFLICILDGANIFKPEQYCKLISDPIFGMYDTIHENAVIGDGDIISCIQSLETLTTDKLTNLIQCYDLTVKNPMPEVIKNGLKCVGEELYNLLESKLIRFVMKDFNNAIYRGAFGVDIDWSNDSLPIKPDGWPIYIINKCIEFKLLWGDIYVYTITKITNLIATSILNVVHKLSRMSDNGILKIKLNVMIIKEGFGSEPKKIFDQIDKLLLLKNGGTTISSEKYAVLDEEFLTIQSRIALQCKSLYITPRTRSIKN